MNLDSVNRSGVAAFKHFLSGKLISILLTLGYFFLLTRYLSLGEYADYVTAIALAEVLIGVSTLGLDWLAVIKIPKIDSARDSEQATLFRSLLSARISTLVAFFLVAVISVVLASLFFDNMQPVMLGICYALVEGLHRYVATALLDSALQQRTSKRMWIGKSGIQFLACGGALFWAPHMLTAHFAIVVEAIGSAAGLLIAAPKLRSILRPVSIDLNVPLLREGLRTFATEWSLIAPSYTGSLMSWVGNASTFVLLARILGGDVVTALIGFCATLTNQVRRYLPTEMFLGVARAFIYTRFANHGSAKLLEQDLHLFFGIGMAAVILGTTLFTLLGQPIIELLSNGKFPDTLPLLLLSIGGLAGMVGRRITETAANAIAATHIWAVATAQSAAAVPIAGIAFYFSEQPIALVLGWVTVDLVATATLHYQLTRQRAMCAIPIALVLKALALLPLLAFGYWVVQQTHTRMQYAVVCATFLSFTCLLLERVGFVSLTTARQMFKATKA